MKCMIHLLLIHYTRHLVIMIIIRSLLTKHNDYYDRFRLFIIIQTTRVCNYSVNHLHNDLFVWDLISCIVLVKHFLSSLYLVCFE
jgi:hypothetical protein